MEEKVPFSSNTFTYIMSNRKMLLNYFKYKKTLIKN